MTDPIRKALVVRGGWEGHAPVEITDLFLPFLKDQGFAVEISDSLDVYADAALLAATDLVVQCWTMGEITAEQSRGLADAVRAGTGFAGWHGGIIDSFRGDVDYQRLTGGQFLMHPPGFVDYTVHLAPPATGSPRAWRTSPCTPSTTGWPPTRPTRFWPARSSRPAATGRRMW